jgi:1-acyl-sn-glycerol-3-phosphate acyltransferase
VARLRIACRLTLGILILLMSFAGHGLWCLFGLDSPWPRFFLIRFGRAMGLSVEVRGTPVPQYVLYVANHLSWLDILAVGGATGSAFVAKSDIDGWPVVGLIARIGGTIFVDRDNRRAARGQVDQIGEALRRGKPIMLFPEGTTNDGKTLFPFRPALFASVAPAPDGISVQPVAIDYQAAASDIAWCGEEPLAPNAMRVLARRGGLKVVLHFLPALAPSTDRKLLAASSLAAIEQALTPPASA